VSPKRKLAHKVVVPDLKAPVVLPVDVDQCQVDVEPSPVEKLAGLGVTTHRCPKKPTWIITSHMGAMSVCNDHKKIADEQLRDFTAQPIVRRK
jgi:hypothetical protein